MDQLLPIELDEMNILTSIRGEKIWFNIATLNAGTLLSDEKLIDIELDLDNISQGI